MRNCNQWIPRRGPVALDRNRNPLTQATGWIYDRSAWMSYDEARTVASDPDTSADGYGFALTDSDPYFCIDIDDCLIGGQWSAFAVDLCSRFAGARIEVSGGGRGLHIFGSSRSIPPHGSVNGTVNGCGKLELYSSRHYAKVTDINATGDADTDCTTMFLWFCEQYFPARATGDGMGWTDEPCALWSGSDDDNVLIGQALNSQSMRSVMGLTVSFGDLWEAREDQLAARWPQTQPGKGRYDASHADAALAQHLAFWTGKNCERVERLMRQSALVRDKWDEHPSYLRMTILEACAICDRVYGQPTDVGPGSSEVAPHGVNSSQEPVKPSPTSTPQSPTVTYADHVKTRIGVQMLTAQQQVTYFEGCVYVTSENKIMMSNGTMLDQGRFKARKGGYSFQFSPDGGKFCENAWQVFTESQLMHFPKVDDKAFRPDLGSGVIFTEFGLTKVNTFNMPPIHRVKGDPSRFLNHLEKMLPDENDRSILINYMASCIQMRGIKFKWMPIIQSVQGVGKGMIAKIIAYANGGRRYCMAIPPNGLDSQFNAWLARKVFVYFDELRVPEHQAIVNEMLKILVDADEAMVQPKGIDQEMESVCVNGLGMTNYKDCGIKIDRNERRYAMLYCAQQEASDLVRDGMSGSYFPSLWNWLREEGYAIMTDYLENHQIPQEFKDALRNRAPATSCLEEALQAGMGPVEQMVQEAIREGIEGFRGAWVSSIALGDLLDRNRKTTAVPPNRRRDLMRRLGYDHHPALPDGRLGTTTIVDRDKRPTLFCRIDSAAWQLPASEVAICYVAAQRGEPVPSAYGHQASR